MRVLCFLAALAAVASAASLEEELEQFKPCAILCYNAAAEDVECSLGDFACICSNPDSLIVKMKICAGKTCDGETRGSEYISWSRRPYWNMGR
jgi:hypothetical protein